MIKTKNDLWIKSEIQLPKHNRIVVGWFGSNPKILIYNKRENMFYDYEKEKAYQPYNIKYWCYVPSTKELEI